MKTLNMSAEQAHILLDLVQQARQRHDAYWERNYQRMSPEVRSFLREEFGNLNALLFALTMIVKEDK